MNIYIYDGKKQAVHINHPGDELIPLNPLDLKIIEKLKKFNSKYNITKSINSYFIKLVLFGIQSEFVELNPDKVKLYHEGDILEDDEIKLFTNNKAGKSGIPKWYITKRANIPINKHLIDKYKVVSSSAGPCNINTMSILPPNTAFGRSRMALGLFDTEEEAINFLKYIKSKFILHTLMLTSGTNNIGKITPALPNYTNNNSILDFNKDLDAQFIQLLELTDEEWNHIETYKPISI